MQNQLPLHVIVSPEVGAMRLDALLGILLPHLGLRARRRLWQWCNICVNGKPQPQGYMVKAGDAVEITEVIHHAQSSSLITYANSHQDCFGKSHIANALHPINEKEKSAMLSALKHENKNSHVCKEESRELPLSCKTEAPCLLTIKGEFALFFKPKYLHTAAIAGKQTVSLEASAPSLWQAYLGTDEGHSELPILLTRLDYLTSGIIVAAKNTEAASRFRQWEQQGHVIKNYYATVRGCIEKAFTVKNALHTAKRKKTAVLLEEDDITRWTTVDPVAYLAERDLLSLPVAHWQNPLLPEKICNQQEEEQNITLARIALSRGARHQIRAHMAFTGYPLTGDPLYGSDELPFLLHHASIKTPEFFFELLPDWLSHA